MKKGERYIGTVTHIAFPNRGIVTVDGETAVVKNALPGQEVEFVVGKKRNGRCEGRLLRVVTPSPLENEPERCPHFGICGGCTFQSIPYEEQLKIKEQQVRELLQPVVDRQACTFGRIFEGVKPSPLPSEYRNKMEFSFGDEEKGGPLALGLHRRGSFHDVVNTDGCRIVHPDFTRILSATREYFAAEGISFYRKLQHSGYLRHLLVRRAVKTGEILVALVTSGQTENGDADQIRMETAEPVQFEGKSGTAGLKQSAASTDEVRHGFPLNKQDEAALLAGWRDAMLSLPLEGRFAGILHIRNDSLADVVQSDETTVLYGQEYFYEELLGLRFKISPFSFFQTNSLGAEVLYDTVREYVGDTNGKVVFDLYSGTGTIAQMLAPVAEKVIGVEIVAEAVDAARQNAARNGLDNCEFIVGDVMKVLAAWGAGNGSGAGNSGGTADDAAAGAANDTAAGAADDATAGAAGDTAVGAADNIAAGVSPDIIILDPPRDGIHPKALDRIGGEIRARRIVYVSCKPTSLARDLEKLMMYGYVPERICCVDMFPSSANIETACLLDQGSRKAGH